MYNKYMARGWESKSVEQQIEESQADRNDSSMTDSGTEDPELIRIREGLRLQRTRILQELHSSRNPRYQALLREMLHHIEDQLFHP